MGPHLDTALSRPSRHIPDTESASRHALHISTPDFLTINGNVCGYVAQSFTWSLTNRRGRTRRRRQEERMDPDGETAVGMDRWIDG